MTLITSAIRLGTILFSPHPMPSLANDQIRMARLRIVFLILFLGFGAAGIFYYWQSIYLGRRFPFNTFLSVPQARFSDYTNMLMMCRDLNPYHTESRSGYPPLANVFYFLFTKLPKSLGEAIYFVVPLVYLFASTYRKLAHLPLFYKLQAALGLLISYPVLFALDRGNLDLWIMLFLGVFLTHYQSTDPTLGEVANLSLAIAISLKLYPVLFVILYVKDRRFFDLAKVGLICALSTIAASALFAGGAYNALYDFAGMLSTTDSLVTQTLLYGSSNVGIYYACKILVELFHLGISAQDVALLYKRCAVIIIVLSVVAILVKRMEVWASATCIVCLTCLLPTLSNDYRMVNFLCPLILVVNARSPRPISTVTTIVVVSLLMVPKNYYLFFPDIARGDIGIADLLNPLLIAVLLGAMILNTEAGTLDGKHSEACPERKKSLLLSAVISVVAFVSFLTIREWLAPDAWQSLNNWGTWLLVLSLPFLAIHIWCVRAIIGDLRPRHPGR